MAQTQRLTKSILKGLIITKPDPAAHLALPNLIGRFGGAFVATHARPWRVEQRHWFAVILVGMRLSMRSAHIAGFVLFIEAFDAHPSRWLAALLAKRLRHDVTRQQNNRMPGRRLALARRSTTLTSVSEVVPKSYRWRSTRPGSKTASALSDISNSIPCQPPIVNWLRWPQHSSQIARR